VLDESSSDSIVSVSSLNGAYLAAGTPPNEEGAPRAAPLPRCADRISSDRRSGRRTSSRAQRHRQRMRVHRLLPEDVRQRTAPPVRFAEGPNDGHQTGQTGMESDAMPSTSVPGLVLSPRRALAWSGGGAEPQQDTVNQHDVLAGLGDEIELDRILNAIPLRVRDPSAEDE
jgi:hypothetical protein